MKHFWSYTLRSAGILLIFPVISQAQVPVDDAGNVLGKAVVTAEIETIGEPGNDGIPRLSHIELQELVGPVALYPDDLLAIVLPASAYPLQIAAAARFLEDLKLDPSLQPDPEWDDSVVALVNYPEVVELLNRDLDWTYRLGEAVVAQQADVIAAVEGFRDRAYAAGNLQSDAYQTVSRKTGVIEIEPIAEDVIYVPYYEPERVVRYQPRPSYYYYPRPCPVYYYPYESGHYFDRGYFWGVTTAFSIGWFSDSLNVFHHSYRNHPYYGHRYRDNWWYRRPTINVYNTTYVNRTRVTVNRIYDGDRWRARADRREFVTREGYADRPRRRESSQRRIEASSFRERTIDRQPRNRNIRQHEQRSHTERRELYTSRRTTRDEQPATRRSTAKPATPQELNRRAYSPQARIRAANSENERRSPVRRQETRQHTAPSAVQTQRRQVTESRRLAATQSQRRQHTPTRERGEVYTRTQRRTETRDTQPGARQRSERDVRHRQSESRRSETPVRSQQRSVTRQSADNSAGSKRRSRSEGRSRRR